MKFKSCCILTAVSALIIFTAQLFAFDPANTLIVYEGGSGDYYDCIEDAVEDAAAGDAIVIYPGDYTDTGVSIDEKIDLIGVGNVNWSGSSTLFSLTADDVSFEGISFGMTTSAVMADFDTFRYVMKNCTVRCETFDFGRDTSHWIGCNLYPKSSTGWEIKNIYVRDAALVQMRDCKVGDDLPIQTETCYGLNVEGDATLSAYYCGFYSDSTSIYADDGRLRIYYSMFIGERRSAIIAEGSSKVSCMYSSFESDDQTDYKPTLEFLDQTSAHLNKCIVRNMKGGHSIYTKTDTLIVLIDNNFKDTLYFDEPSAADAGDVKLIGFNSISYGNLDDQTGAASTVYGNIVNMHAYGDTLFDGYDDEIEVYVNGMPGDAVVNVTYNHWRDVSAGDVVMAIEVNSGGGFFTVYRSDTNNTENLGFYWSADWVEENQ